MVVSLIRLGSSESTTLRSKTINGQVVAKGYDTET
nr:MAG TPA: hypothetical protein [Caudoviricetes sp.]